MWQDEVSHYFFGFILLISIINIISQLKNTKTIKFKLKKWVKKWKTNFFYNFRKENSKFSHLFLNCMLLQWKKNIFLTLVLKLGIKLLIYLGSGWGKQVIVVLRAHLKVRVQKYQIWGVVGLSVVSSLIAYIGYRSHG